MASPVAAILTVTVLTTVLEGQASALQHGIGGFDLLSHPGRDIHQNANGADANGGNGGNANGGNAINNSFNK